jgi:ribonuclease P protein component
VNFSRKHRLIANEEFKSIFDKAEKISQKQVTVLYKPSHNTYPRLGISVGKRTSSSAVRRNRIKRIIRESFRLNRENLKNVDIIVIARQACDKLSNQKLREALEKLWEKLRKST